MGEIQNSNRNMEAVSLDMRMFPTLFVAARVCLSLTAENCSIIKMATEAATLKRYRQDKNAVSHNQ